MQYSANRMRGWKLAARDGDIGEAREVYVDDQRWVIRHVVADTGGWLLGRKVLISPHAIKRLEPTQERVEVALTRQQIKDAPDVDTDKPVSRQQETVYYEHYGYPHYWAGAGLWGLSAYPLMGAFPPPAGVADQEMARAAEAEQQAADPHLRSSAEMRGYDIQATDGSIGHIEDFIFDDRTWQIRFVVVDTGNWLPGRLVLVPPQWITELDWGAQCARVKVARETVRASPPYAPKAHWSDEELKRIQSHYEGWQ